MRPDRSHPTAVTAGVTLVETLTARAQLDDVGVTAIDELGRRTARSWRDIESGAALRAGWLRALGVAPGDPVIIALPNDLRFLDVVFGCWFAGAIPVPIAPPHLFGAPTAERATHVVADVRARLVLTAPEDVDHFAHLGAPVQAVRLDATGEAPIRLRPEPSAVALIQYTSGSTARPRGVTLSHANLLANCHGLTAGDVFGADTRICGWLPLYHDMGLISQLLVALYLGVPYFLIEPSTFLMDPLVWLQTVSTERCTLTHAPNFALAHAIRRISPAVRATLDLRCVERLVLGGEPISAAQVDRFVDAFASAGLSPRAILAAYGLAESVVGVTRSPAGQGLVTDAVDPNALETNQAIPDDTPAAMRIPCVGPPLPGHAVQVVDAAGAPLTDRQVGRVLCTGPSLMQGYWRQPAATATAFVEHDGVRWLDTGDLGYRVDGALYICGRAKELIIVRGRNIHPHDVERLAEEVDGVRRGQAIAFGVQTEAGEVAVLVAESTAPTDGHPGIIAAVRRAVLGGLGLKLHAVVLTPRGTTPKTTSGKRQRLRARRLYAAQRGAR